MPATRSILVGRLQVLEVVGLVDEEVIDAQLVEDQAVVLLVLGEQVLQPLLAVGLLLLDGLDDVAVGARSRRCWRRRRSSCVVLGDLLAQEPLLVVPRHADALEASCA